MLNLCIEDLQRIVGGEVKLGLMPPLAGTLEPLRRVVVDSSRARPGDVYWALTGTNYDGACTAEEAFARGALGIVVSSRPVEPWAGKFVLRVPDANEALLRLSEYERLRALGRQRRPPPFHGGDSTGMVAALLSGGNVTVDAIVQCRSQNQTCVVA
jgi:UDP-N-acetylmuramyl pentapeptide synthase